MQMDDLERDDPWQEIGAIVPVHQRPQAEHVPSSNCSPKSERRPPINPAIMELLAELAVRFPKTSDEAGDALRLRLLAEDLSGNLAPQDLADAIKSGVRKWRYLPTLAEVMDEARPHIEHRRWMAQHRAQQRQLADQRAYAKPYVPSVEQQARTDAVLAEMRRKLAEGDAQLRNVSAEPLPRPISWCALEGSGMAVSAGLKALAARMQAEQMEQA